HRARNRRCNAAPRARDQALAGAGGGREGRRVVAPLTRRARTHSGAFRISPHSGFRAKRPFFPYVLSPRARSFTESKVSSALALDALRRAAPRSVAALPRPGGGYRAHGARPRTGREALRTTDGDRGNRGWDPARALVFRTPISRGVHDAVRAGLPRSAHLGEPARPRALHVPRRALARLEDAPGAGAGVPRHRPREHRGPFRARVPARLLLARRPL